MYHIRVPIPQETRGYGNSTGARVTGCCGPPYVDTGNWSPLQKQCTLLTAELYLQSKFLFLTDWCWRDSGRSGHIFFGMWSGAISESLEIRRLFGYWDNAHYHDELGIEMCLVAIIAIALDTLIMLRCLVSSDWWLVMWQPGNGVTGRETVLSLSLNRILILWAFTRLQELS